MKIIFLAFLMCLPLVGVVAQNESQEGDLMKSILKSEMKVFFAENMTLKTSENVQFWEIYDDFESELKPIFNKRLSLLGKIIDNSGELGAEEMDSMIKEALKLREQRIKLREKYYKIYKKKMGIGVAAQFFQLDQYVNNLAASELNKNMPIIIPGEGK